MNNKNFNKFKIIFFLLLFCFNANSSEQFQFEVTEIEILENGNLFKGIKRGTIQTNGGIIIKADNFVYDKITNIINAEGKVEIEDKINNYTIFSEKLIYKKNEEFIITDGNSKALDEKNKVITAKKFTYNKILNILNAEGNARIEDISEDYVIYSGYITYYKNDEKITTKGETEADIKSEYNIKSRDVVYLEKLKKLSSKQKTVLKDSNSQIYFLDEFDYLIDKSQLSGKNILTITNYNQPKSDKFYFSEGIFNINNKDFVAKDTKIEVHKDVFGNVDNDPRIYGVSSEGDKNLTKIKKGIFTSCQKRDGCPPWTIKSELIEHDREKRQISYKNAFLNLYDVPVLYFPKFFHPDPSVERQTGLLRPVNNNSDILGSSLTIPYFKVLSENQDYTFTPTWFDNDILSFQNEYRKSNKNSQFIADFGLIKGYQSNTTKQRNSLSHIFVNYDLDLKLDKFDTSNLFMSMEQVSNDTYLKVFDAFITKSKVRPDNLNVLNNQIKLTLDNKDYNFVSGFHAYEDLNEGKNSDRYQYILPYYNFDTVLEQKYFNGNISFNSSGSNNLSETNNLKSNIINNISYAKNNINNYGFNNNFNFNLKNLNSIGKMNSDYKSSPQIELVSLFEVNSSLPLVKENKIYANYLTPKISFRFNPTDMKDNSNSSKRINNGNIFALNRLGLNDTFETGRSLTLGLNYKREKRNLEDINKFFEFNLATVVRDKEENFIPKTSTINKKNSNLFGSITNRYTDNLELEYKFALDNDLSTFEYNDVSATFSVNNLINTFGFIEENGEMGDSNVFENSISYNINDNNLLTFKTRRNRKINLTEYYDLVYEYQNDCLIAGVKYKKSYYEDRDVKPTENLLFTITIFPLTTYEYNADDFMESEFWQNK
tara:strand:+ start:1183 stop:3834 length:2652 start_codon:yes stop_codon:yes gene_type:complete